jgi:hypothetical protein
VCGSLRKSPVSHRWNWARLGGVPPLARSSDRAAFSYARRKLPYLCRPLSSSSAANSVGCPVIGRSGSMLKRDYPVRLAEPGDGHETQMRHPCQRRDGYGATT